MKTGWTGMQFSLWRILTALAAMAFTVPRWGPHGTTIWGQIPYGSWALVIIVIAATGLLLGWFARPATLVLLPFAILTPSPSPFFNLPLTLALVLFLLAAPGPFGSLKARGRPDPRGGWSLDPYLSIGAWALWIGFFLAFHFGLFENHPLLLAWQEMPLGKSMGLGTVLFLIPLCFWRVTRPFAWLGMLWVQVCFLFMGWGAALWPALLILFLGANPSWFSAAAPVKKDLVFYDGNCGLCHRSCRILLAEDPDGHSFQFAPLQGPTFEEDPLFQKGAPLPDSIVVRTNAGQILTEFAAVRHLGMRLGGIWRVLALCSHTLPLSLGNLGYRMIAKNRYRFFAKPENTCPILPPDLRQRFLP